MLERTRACWKRAGTLLVIALLVGWPALVGAGKPWDVPGTLGPDAYWYNNEDHTPESLLGSLSVVQVEAIERYAEMGAQETGIITAQVLHPDAYWYNNEDHTPGSLLASTPSVTPVTHAQAR